MKYQGSNSITYLITLIKGALLKKVDKVDGKGLSTNDLTNILKSNYDTAYTHSQSAHAPSNAQANVIETINVDGSALTVSNKAVNIDLSGKVDKVSGKGLSTNDYTTTEKNKLSGIDTGAQVNVIETIKVNGTAQTVTSKGVNISVPTNNNQLTNGAGYQTSSQVESAITSKGYQTATQVNSAITSKGYQTSSDVQTAINNAMKDITGFEFSIVTSLPDTGVKGVIYLIAHSHGTGDGYDEYIWIGSSYEKIGNTDIDLSGYAQTKDLVEMTNTEVQTAWDNVMNA